MSPVITGASTLRHSLLAVDITAHLWSETLRYLIMRDSSTFFSPFQTPGMNGQRTIGIVSFHYHDIKAVYKPGKRLIIPPDLPPVITLYSRRRGFGCLVVTLIPFHEGSNRDLVGGVTILNPFLWVGQAHHSIFPVDGAEV